MYALIDMKGKQYKAEKGALLRMDRIGVSPHIIGVRRS